MTAIFTKSAWSGFKSIPRIFQHNLSGPIWERHLSPMNGMYLLWYVVLLLPCVSYALDCPGIPEQARNDMEVEVRAAVGKIGSAKGAELETRTRNITRDLLGKLPQADRVYLELMMYAAYCSTLRDDPTLAESQKSTLIKAYNLELKKSLQVVQGDPDQRRTSAKDKARAELKRLPLPYTTDAFVESAKNGNLAAIKLFLAAGIDPNAKKEDSDYKNTALMLAAGGGHIEIVRALLKAKANVNERNNRPGNRPGHTALSWAVAQNNRDIVALLLDQGPDTDTIDADVWSAAREGYVEVLRMLLKYGGDKVNNKARNDALIAAAGGLRSEATRNEVIRFLLVQGGDVNAKDKQGCTALEMAIWDEGATIVRTLLDAGANVNTKSMCNMYSRIQGWTPLMWAVFRAHNPGGKSIVNMLLARGADPNLDADPNNDSKGGETALMIASESNNIELVRALLDRGADPNIVSKEGGTALMSASGKKNNVDTVHLLLEKGVDPNIASKTGYTALIAASRSEDNMDTIALLLRKGANPNAKSKGRHDDDAYTALMSAAESGHVSNIEALLDGGVDLHARSVKGRTALMLAVQKGRVEVVQALLRRGARVRDKDANSKTTLNYAEEDLKDQERTDMIRILKNAGAK